MKNLLAVALLGLVLSIPSIVFAEASWYGSIRTGIESAPQKIDEDNYTSAQTGVADFASRWGIQGSNEVSEGLTAVYRYERSINSPDAGDGGRLSYVGLSGGFGTVTIGQIWGAAYNHFGGVVDQALWYGKMGDYTGLRFANAVSYAVSVGNVSLQADAIMDQSTGKTGDGFNFGATLGGLMETGSVAIAHRKNQDDGAQSQSSSYIAGNYGIGDMTVFLGYSPGTFEKSDCTAELVNAEQDTTACATKLKVKSTFTGVHGGIGDTGVNYVFTIRNVKVAADGFEDADDDPDTADATAYTSNTESTPWTLGLSKSLGGGATLNFEYSEPDSVADATNSDEDSSTAIWLQVDF